MEEDDRIKCPLCGGTLIWGGDNDACDLSDMYDDDDGAIMGNYTCSQCGRYIEIIDPPRTEREGRYRDYWEGDRVTDTK